MALSKRACAIAIAITCALAAGARAEHLPLRTYTSADGLANGRVWAMARDARGFLWFATQDGMSRFDGNRFESFGIADGLPAVDCEGVVVTRDGIVWVATDGGIAWLDPEERAVRPRFHALHVGADGRDDAAITFFEDHAGQLWLATEGGLWTIARPDRAIARVPLWTPGKRQPTVFQIVEDRDHALWLATGVGLERREADGAIEHAHFGGPDQPDDRTFSIAIDRANRVWIGNIAHGLVAMVPPPRGAPLLAAGDWLLAAGRRAGASRNADGTERLPTAPGELRYYGDADGVPEPGHRKHGYTDARGGIWFGGMYPVHFDGQRFDVISPARGFPDDPAVPCGEDAAGNLWFCGSTAGVTRLARQGLVAYDTRDGLASLVVSSVFEDDAGALYATSYALGHVLHRLDGERFVAVRPGGAGAFAGAWGVNQVGFRAHDGSWWYLSSDALLHYPSVPRLEDLATATARIFTVADGLPGHDLQHAFEDARGDVWLGTMSASGLARWNHATDRITLISAPGLPGGVPISFAEDRAHDLWISYEHGELVRMRQGDPRDLLVLGPADGLTAQAGAAFVDSRGRLWFATFAGLLRFDDPGAAHPRHITYTRAQGLATDQCLVVGEDRRGRIYVGGTHGVDRLDPDTGEVGHLSMVDGLPSDWIDAIYRDRAGRMWIATQGGLARLPPDDAPPGPPPPAYLTSVQAGGDPRPLAMGGDREAPALDLAHDEGELDLAFTSPSFEAGRPVEFQVRLEGADDTWSAPTRAREVHYAHLAPGDYRFLVRAVFAGGLASAPASIAVTVRPPFWVRWWFRALCASALALIAWALYRRRVAHLVAVERVRTRIATDLHDDLGSSLSRIAILSELAARRAGPDAGPIAEVVDDIGRSARDLVDVAGDIVWSTDPRKDDLGSLLVRLRSYAGDVLESQGIAWTLEAPSEPGRIHLGPDERRHLYLVVKEAVNNAAKHAQPTRVTIAITRAGAGLAATIVDDGRGVDAARAAAEADAAPRTRGGNGLGNMQARAAAAGGTLVIDVPPGGGTRVTLRLPLRG